MEMIDWKREPGMTGSSQYLFFILRKPVKKDKLTFVETAFVGAIECGRLTVQFLGFFFHGETCTRRYVWGK